MGALSAVYGAAATWRRRWYSGARSKRLRQPVISIGNLCVGGTGKTPVTAYVARLLAGHGERPVILSRGYARERASRDVTVVSTRDQVIADVAHSGDEPMLLARTLPGVPVLVCADRFRAGQEAEARFGASVHILDDGFQHVQLARDINLLLVGLDDLDDRVLPAGRLREPLANAAAADALLVPGETRSAMARVAARLRLEPAYWVQRRLAPVRSLAPAPHQELPSPDAPWLAFAGIARPDRFFSDVRAAGFNVIDTVAFRDHHIFRAADLHTLRERARAAGAVGLITTEKDSMRLPQDAASTMPVAVAPLEVAVDPANNFSQWLLARLADARAEAGGRS